MVVSRVAPETLPALTQLPAVTSVRPMRPEIGAAMVAKDRSSSADFTLASATLTAAWASFRSAMRSSKVLSEMILRSTSGRPRTMSRLAFSTLVVAANSSALAWSSARSNGRGSMANRRSPCLTCWPSLNFTSLRWPDTRALISTVSLASKRPVYSSHSTISRSTGLATLTVGSGGAAFCGAACEGP